jgi:hypothetical protein
MKKKSRSLERQSMAVNPFLTIMYHNMSFNAWKAIFSKQLDRRSKEEKEEREREDSFIVTSDDDSVYTYETDNMQELEGSDLEIDDKEFIVIDKKVAQPNRAPPGNLSESR